MDQKPSVGRIVHFYPGAGDNNTRPLPAMIACVWSETCVNVAVWDANGRSMAQPPTSVPLFVSPVGLDSWQRPMHAHWSWPPRV